MRTVRIVGIDDWVGLYIDGNLKYEGHSLPTEFFITNMQKAGLLNDIDIKDDYNNELDEIMRRDNISHLPQSYAEIDKMLTEDKELKEW